MPSRPTGDPFAPDAVSLKCEMIGGRGRSKFGRGFLPGAATLLALALTLTAAPAAQARVTLVATGTPELAFLGIPSNEIVARLALPGPARAVAISRNGARGYVTAGSEVVALAGKLEMELAELAPEDATEFMEALGIVESGLARVIQVSYRLARLLSFFTVGADECRAWTIRAGSTAVEAAGAIHSDLARGFIRAEVIGWDQLLEAATFVAP